MISLLETLGDTDATDFTDCRCLARRRGKNRNKEAPFRGFREIRVQKKTAITI